MQSKKKITLSSSDSQGKWILWTYFNFPRSECYILKTVIHKDRLLMFSNSNLFHRHKSGHFFLEEFMNQIKFPLTCLSLHITMIMNMIQSQWIGTSHHGILFTEKDKVFSDDGPCHFPSNSLFVVMTLSLCWFYKMGSCRHGQKSFPLPHTLYCCFYKTFRMEHPHSPTNKISHLHLLAQVALFGYRC